MRISDWSSDVCSSDLEAGERARRVGRAWSSRSFSWLDLARGKGETMIDAPADRHPVSALRRHIDGHADDQRSGARHVGGDAAMVAMRSEEHTSELQSLMRISYAVFCLKKKKQKD